MKVKLSIGCFSIQSSTGEIMPNETAQIDIECTPQKNEEYKEIVTLFISESLDKNKDGKRITLSVIGCEPVLNFDNLRKIFREQYITDKLENLNCSKIVSCYVVPTFHMLSLTY